MTDQLSLKDLVDVARKGALAFLIALAVGSTSIFYAVRLSEQAGDVDKQTLIVSGVAALLGAAIVGFLVGYLRRVIGRSRRQDNSIL